MKYEALLLRVLCCLAPPASIMCDAISLGRNWSAPVPRLDPQKLAWLHVPKSGSSVANMLITWACPRIPDSYTYELGMPDVRWNKLYQHYCVPGFELHGDHHAVSEDYRKLRERERNFVGFFRQPEQRIISGWHDNLHDYKGTDPSPNITQYAEWVSGCDVKMMYGRRCGTPFATGRKIIYETMLRLVEHFAFVGLTEHWDLSVCLFHRMFGGDCHRREFRHLRPGRKQLPSGRYDTSVLGGFVDHVDGLFYDEATLLFWRSVKQFGVNQSSCAKICSKHPDPFTPRGDAQELALVPGGGYEYDWPGRGVYDEE